MKSPLNHHEITIKSPLNHHEIPMKSPFPTGIGAPFLLPMHRRSRGHGHRCSARQVEVPSSHAGLQRKGTTPGGEQKPWPIYIYIFMNMI